MWRERETTNKVPLMFSVVKVLTYVNVTIAFLDPVKKQAKYLVF